MSLEGYYVMQNVNDEQEVRLNGEHFVCEEMDQDLESYQFVHYPTEKTPQLVAHYDADNNHLDIDLPEGYEEVDDQLNIAGWATQSDEYSEYGYDCDYED